MKFVFWFIRFLARGVTKAIPLCAILAIRNFIFQMIVTFHLLKVRPMRKTSHTSQYFHPFRVNVPDYNDSSQFVLKDKHVQLHKLLRSSKAI